MGVINAGGEGGVKGVCVVEGEDVQGVVVLQGGLTVKGGVDGAFLDVGKQHVVWGDGGVQEVTGFRAACVDHVQVDVGVEIG